MTKEVNNALPVLEKLAKGGLILTFGKEIDNIKLNVGISSLQYLIYPLSHHQLRFNYERKDQEEEINVNEICINHRGVIQIELNDNSTTYLISNSNMLDQISQVRPYSDMIKIMDFFTFSFNDYRKKFYH